MVLVWARRGQRNSGRAGLPADELAVGAAERRRAGGRAERRLRAAWSSRRRRHVGEEAMWSEGEVSWEKRKVWTGTGRQARWRTAAAAGSDPTWPDLT